MTKKRVRRREGDILRIDLGDGTFSYAQVSTDPLFVFFDGRFTSDAQLEKVSHSPVLFRLWVDDYAVTKAVWDIVGSAPIARENVQMPVFFKQDAISGRLSIYHSSFPNSERPASLEECEGLERAAVWDPVQVVDRLRDHYANRPNKWVESLRIKLPDPIQR